MLWMLHNVSAERRAVTPSARADFQRMNFRTSTFRANFCIALCRSSELSLEATANVQHRPENVRFLNENIVFFLVLVLRGQPRSAPPFAKPRWYHAKKIRVFPTSTWPSKTANALQEISERRLLRVWLFNYSNVPEFFAVAFELNFAQRRTLQCSEITRSVLAA